MTVSILGLGTAVVLPEYGLGTSVPKGDGYEGIIRKATQSGIRYIDTAAHYGHSEALIGSVSDLLQLKKVRVCTKLAAGDRIDGSLGRLRSRRIDTVLMHSADERRLGDPERIDYLQHLRATKVVERIGASTYGVDDALFGLEQSWCDTIQIEHSILNPSVARELAGHRRPDQEIVVRSVLCKGLLTGRRQFASNFPASVRRKIDVLERLAAEWGMSLPGLSIRFALDTPGVNVVLVGIDNERELGCAIDALGRSPLAAGKLDKLAEFDCSSEDWVHPERWQVGK